MNGFCKPRLRILVNRRCICKRDLVLNDVGSCGLTSFKSQMSNVDSIWLLLMLHECHLESISFDAASGSGNMFPPIVKPRIQTVAVVDIPNTTDRNCVPISKVFDRFRNMRATSNRAEYTSQIASCSRPLAAVGSSDRGSVYTRVMPVSKVPKAALAGLSSNNTRKNLQRTYIPYNSICQALLGTFNHAYLCLDSKGCIIRHALITILNTACKTENRGHVPVKYPHINNNLPYSEGDLLCLTLFTSN
ncbi:hypothetical protein Tco_1384958 [Tanacetum coccineum]